MELILLGDLFIFVGGFMFGSFWQKSRRTKRPPDVTTCRKVGHNWHRGVCLRCEEREYNPSRG